MTDSHPLHRPEGPADPADASASPDLDAPENDRPVAPEDIDEPDDNDAPDDIDEFEFDAVPVRRRVDGWTPGRQVNFIEALAESGCVAEACRTVGMSERSAYRLRARPEAISFRNAWDAALDYAIRRLSDAALSRALNGVVVPKFYQGEQIGECRHYDERLTMFLLRHRDPLRYGRYIERSDWKGHPEGQALDLLEAKQAVREDGGLSVDDLAKRFHRRLADIVARVTRGAGA